MGVPERTTDHSSLREADGVVGGMIMRKRAKKRDRFFSYFESMRYGVDRLGVEGGGEGVGSCHTRCFATQTAMRYLASEGVK